MKKVLLAALIMFGAITVKAYEYKVWREQVNFSHGAAMNSYGDLFTSNVSADLEHLSTTWMLIDLTTATKHVYITDFEISLSSGAYNATISHTPTVVTSGTLNSVTQYNDTLSKVSNTSAHIYDASGNITSDGTTIDYIQSPADIISTNKSPLILKTGRSYLISLQNDSGATANGQIKIWYFEK